MNCLFVFLFVFLFVNLSVECFTELRRIAWFPSSWGVVAPSFGFHAPTQRSKPRCCISSWQRSQRMGSPTSWLKLDLPQI